MHTHHIHIHIHTALLASFLLDQHSATMMHTHIHPHSHMHIHTHTHTGSNTHNNGPPGGDGQTGDAGEGTGGTCMHVYIKMQFKCAIICTILLIMCATGSTLWSYTNACCVHIQNGPIPFLSVLIPFQVLTGKILSRSQTPTQTTHCRGQIQLCSAMLRPCGPPGTCLLPTWIQKIWPWPLLVQDSTSATETNPTATTRLNLQTATQNFKGS